MSKIEGRKGRMFIGAGLAAIGLGVVGAIALSGTGEVPQPVARQVPPEVVRRDAGTPVVDEIDHAARASELLQEGDDVGAMKELARAVAKAPDDVELQWKIARLDDGAAGRKALGEIARLTPEDAEPLFELARRSLDANEWDGALAASLAAVKRAPAAWEAYQLKGRALMGKGQLGTAIVAFRQATQQPDAPSFPFNNLGYALLLAGKADAAAEALDAAIARGPVKHYMMNNLGLAFEKVGRFEDAEVAFLGALELKGDYVKAAVNLKRVSETRELVAKQEAEVADEESIEVDTGSAPQEGSAEGAPTSAGGAVHGG